MIITEKDRNDAIAELNLFKASLPSLTKLNLDLSATLIDVNHLTSAGWVDQIKFDNGIEYFINDTVRVELITTVDEVEYRVVAAVSRTLKQSDTPDGLSHLSSEELSRAYRGEIPRLAHMRWVFAYIVNRKDLQIDCITTLPQALFERIERDLRGAIRIPQKEFLDGLHYQTNGYDPIETIENCNEIDELLLKLLSLIKNVRYNEKVAAVARLLAPIAKSVLNSEGYDKKTLITSLSKPEIAMPLASHAHYSGFHEMAAIIFEALLRSNNYSFSIKDADALDSLCRSLLKLGLPVCAKCIISVLMDQFLKHENRDDVEYEVRRAVGNILWAVVDCMRTIPKDIGVCNALQESFRLLKPDWFYDINCVTFDAVFNLYLKEISGEDRNAAFDEVQQCLEIAIEKYNAVHSKDEDSEWKKQLPPSIKNPFVWQAVVYSAYGHTDKVLKAHPFPVSTTEFLPKNLPKHKIVLGLPFSTIWNGLIPATDKDMLDKLIEESKDFSVKHELQDVRLHEYGGASPTLGSRRLCFPTDAKEHELSMLSVEGLMDNSTDAHLLAILPYLPSEHKNFSTNVVAKAWRFYSWANNATAEAMVEIDQGPVRTFYAIMPFYIDDKKYCARGLKFNGRICGFANSIKKDEEKHEPFKPITIKEGPIAEEAGHPVEIAVDPDFLDYFSQDDYKMEASRSGFSLHGRFVSKLIFKAFGNDIACVRIKCARLSFDLEVYISADKVSDSIKENDPIDVEGWLYVDFTNTAEKIDDYLKRFPDEAPLNPLHHDMYGNGAPTWIRTEYTEEEKKRLPDARAYHDFDQYAWQYLSSLEDVDEVELCNKNESHLNFLVRQRGRIRSFAFFHTTDDAPMNAILQNIEVLLLTKKKSGKGVSLNWEIRSPHSDD